MVSYFVRIAAIVAAGVLVHSGAQAQTADAQEISRYALTEAGLAKYSQAARNLAALPGFAEDACKEDEDTSNPESIAELAAQLDAMPGARGAVQAAGMTSREYVVFMMALLQGAMAGWALDQPGGKLPAGISQANVDFVKSHEAELRALESVSSVDCDGAAEEEVPEE